MGEGSLIQGSGGLKGGGQRKTFQQREQHVQRPCEEGCGKGET